MNELVVMKWVHSETREDGYDWYTFTENGRDALNEAKKIGRILVEEKLVACTNIISPIHSIYSWQGKICDY